jgi:hypothetical protein
MGIFRAGCDLLLEQYLDAVEFDVDLVLQNGESVFCSVSQNWPTAEPSFQETGLHLPRTALEQRDAPGLRGGRSGPNYAASHTAKALDLIAAAGLPRRLMVDASHGNSGKDHRRQPAVAAAIAGQVAASQRGLAGVMLESFLAEGRQEPGPPHTLTYGQSVTDACMDFATTAAVLADLAAAVRTRRKFLCRTRRARAPATHHGQPGEGRSMGWLRQVPFFRPLPFARHDHSGSGAHRHGGKIRISVPLQAEHPRPPLPHNDPIPQRVRGVGFRGRRVPHMRCGCQSPG